jgi:hypothetical protein
MIAGFCDVEISGFLLLQHINKSQNQQLVYIFNPPHALITWPVI